MFTWLIRCSEAGLSVSSAVMLTLWNSLSVSGTAPWGDLRLGVLGVSSYMAGTVVVFFGLSSIKMCFNFPNIALNHVWSLSSRFPSRDDRMLNNAI